MIDWLVCPADECPAIGIGRGPHPDVLCPRPPDFLSDSERETLARLTFPKRRREWLLGRWTAKHLLQRSQAAYHSLPLEAITVDNDPDGAPFFYVVGEGRLPASLSISHRDDRAFCALCSPDAVHPCCPPAIGADIERVEPRAPAFVRDFFTVDEAERVWACPPPLHDTLVTVLWSAKEAVLKALRHGLRVDTRRVEIHHVAGLELDHAQSNWHTWPVPEAWHKVHVSCALPGAAHLSAWWRPLPSPALSVPKPAPHTPAWDVEGAVEGSAGDYVLTLAALSPTLLTPRM